MTLHRHWRWGALGLLSSTAVLAADPKLTGRPVAPEARAVLLEILRKAELPSARVTSTSRTAAEQAKVIFDYINEHGYDAALELYGPHGDAIVQVCERSYKKNRACDAPVLDRMVEETRRQLKLLEQQGEQRTELMHTSDTHYAIDIDPESVADPRAFESAATAHARVTRLLEPAEHHNSYHVEILKN